MDVRRDLSHLVVLTTLGSPDAARKLISGLVEDGVVACGTILGGAQSIFRWEGAITEEDEVLVLLKTHRERWEDLRKAVSTRHPYDVPELLAIPVEAGLEAYLDWVTDVTAKGGSKAE
jgi:periplasmic divalent cation tolerance protein